MTNWNADVRNYLFSISVHLLLWVGKYVPWLRVLERKVAMQTFLPVVLWLNWQHPRKWAIFVGADYGGSQDLKLPAIRSLWPGPILASTEMHPNLKPSLLVLTVALHFPLFWSDRGFSLSILRIHHSVLLSDMEDFKNHIEHRQQTINKGALWSCLHVHSNKDCWNKNRVTSYQNGSFVQQ